MTTTYVETDGGKLAVEVEGEGPLVICSPAMGDTRDGYAALGSQLVAAGYRVARFDLRGHGESTADFQRYGDDATADDFLAVLKALGGGPAVLAGSSLSAGAATIAAGRQPDQVAGIVLLAPFLRNPGSKLIVWLFRIMLMRPWGPYIWRTYSATLWPGLGEKAGARAASLIGLLKRPGRWSAFQATVAGADHDAAVGPWLGRAKATPALVIMGDADPDWSDPVAEAHWVASNFTDSKLVTVSGAGHAPMFEKPEIVTQGVLQFLEIIKFNTKVNSTATNADSGLNTAGTDSGV